MDCNLDTITQDDGYIYIFSDGSYNRRLKKIGLGWIIATKNHLDYIERHATIMPSLGKQNLSAQNSLMAEFLAATEGLNDLPEYSNIKLYLDNKSVVAAFTEEVNLQVKRQITRNVLSMFNTARKRHKSITVIEAHDKNSETNPLLKYYMTLAHNAAADAAETNSTKTLLYLPDLQKLSF